MTHRGGNVLSPMSRLYIVHNRMPLDDNSMQFLGHAGVCKGERML